MKFIPTLCTLALLALTSAVSAQEPDLSSQKKALYDAMRWSSGEAIKLTQSGGVLAVKPEEMAVRDTDARVLMKSIDGSEQGTELEAALLDASGENLVVYAYLPEGYITLDDWKDVDADAMMKDMIEGNEEANKQRIENHETPVSLSGWGVRPHLDEATKTVQWSIVGESDNTPLVNAVAIKLGRHGYEHVVAISDSAEKADAILKAGVGAFNFSAGSQYGDYIEGDKLASYGIAGLVAAGVGAKAAAKFGLLAVLLVFLKKAWVLLLVVPIALKKWWDKRRGKTPESAETRTETTQEPSDTPPTH